MRRAMLVAGAVVLSVIGGPQAFGATLYNIGYIVANPQMFMNTAVTVQGTVTQTEATVPQPPDNYRGTYMLQGQDGGTIKVYTSRKAPAPKEWLKVTGVVMASPKEPGVYLREKPQSPWLWGALGVLVVLAAVLVVLLLRRPERDGEDQPLSQSAAVSAGYASAGGISPPLVDYPVSAPTQLGGSGEGAVTCSACGVALPSDATFCDQCGASIGPRAAERPTMVPEGQSQMSAGSKDTVKIPSQPEEQPIADLVAVAGPGARYGHRFGLRKGRQKVGRSEDAEIRLLDDTVSREHALVWWEDGIFYLQDQASTSGTFVNDTKVTRQALNDGDEIRLGQTKLVFRSVANRAESS